jgi:hypothetical protein
MEEKGSVMVMKDGIRTCGLLAGWIVKHPGKIMFRD